MFIMTVGALHPQESVFQPSAFEVISKFLLHMQGQELALHGHHIPEFRVMPLDNLIEKSLFRSMTFLRLAVWRPVRDRGLRHIVLHSMEYSMFSYCSLSV
jgi:hypothetical protein